MAPGPSLLFLAVVLAGGLPRACEGADLAPLAGEQAMADLALRHPGQGRISPTHNEVLQFIARRKAEDMARRQYFSHIFDTNPTLASPPPVLGARLDRQASRFVLAAPLRPDLDSRIRLWIDTTDGGAVWRWRPIEAERQGNDFAVPTGTEARRFFRLSGELLLP